MEAKPVVTKRIYQEIIGQFVEMIRTGTLREGERLPPERSLAEMFQVSRPSVREALRVLETIGLVEIRAGGGAYLRELNLAPFLSMFAPLFTSREGFELELLELRELLESRAVGLAAGNCSEGDIRYLEEPITMMRNALELEDPRAGAKSDILFHTRIIEISGNYVLRKALEFVNSLLEISIEGGRSLVLEKVEDAAQLYDDHRRIFEAIKGNDVDLAKGLMAAHLDMVKEITRRETAVKKE